MSSFVDFLLNNRAPDVMSQGVTIPAKNFIPRYQDTFFSLFSQEVQLHLTRRNVFDAFTKSDIDGFKATLAWGFPRGSKPGGASLNAAIAAFPFFAEKIQKLRKSGLNVDSYKEINSIYGVKNGVTTKFLYFSGIRSTSGAEALIFDSRVKSHLLERDWDEYKDLKKSLIRNKWHLAPKPNEYLQFIEITQKLSIDSGWPASAIEMHMFTDVPSRRKAVHK
jgi:hypothetical protein